MTPGLVLTVIVIYFGMLLFISWITSRNANTDSFFLANRSSPWYLVAFGMIGTSLSGLTFISVPGKVGFANAAGAIPAFSYFQLVMGNLVGYCIIAFILMPLYYKLNLVSIYTYLEQRFGFWSYKTGSLVFLISRTIASALRLYLAAVVLHLFLFQPWGFPFFGTVAITILLIWIYTFKGGIKTIVWTDTFQTVFLVSAVIVSVVMISQELGLNFGDMVSTVSESKYSQIFFWDIKDNKYFFKQFLAGIFLAVVMVGLDQDLMQKNLSCKTIKDAQKNMLSFAGIFFVVNLLFLTLGALLYIYSERTGFQIPTDSDKLFPSLALNEFGLVAGIFFLLGITASSYASSDSALAALTTAFCIDFLDFKKKDESVKKRQKFLVHIGFSVLFLIVILVFQQFSENRSVIDAALGMAAYTYGPLLGLYSFGIFTKRKILDGWAPVVCVLSPFLTWILDFYSEILFWGYRFSFETLIVNGMICFLGLLIISRKATSPEDIAV